MYCNSNWSGLVTEWQCIASNKETKDNDITLSLQETTENQEDSDIDHIQSPEASPVTGGENTTIEEDDRKAWKKEDRDRRRVPNEKKFNRKTSPKWNLFE